MFEPMKPPAPVTKIMLLQYYGIVTVSGSDGHGGRGVGSVAAMSRYARAWLYDAALPLWGQIGVDGQFGFVEHLELDARPAVGIAKRLRVQARQVFVFSAAASLGYAGGVDVARSGWQFMCAHGQLAGGGWARRLGPRGGVVDQTLDLYDQSFALLAMAWWMRASGEDVTGLVEATLEAVQLQLRSPTGIGWLSESGAGGVCAQNPHMHLLEAVLALHAATGEEKYAAWVEQVIDVFTLVLFDRATGTVAEYYDDTWRRVPHEAGGIVEPGHHYEWAWLLWQADAVRPGAAESAGALFDFAERVGCSPTTGLVYDAVLEDGTISAASHRLWPNAEALKAHLARFERGEGLDLERTAQIVHNLFDRFLAVPTRGTWIDQLDERCHARVEKIPASTLYHVFVALTELLRVAPELEALP